MSRQKYGPVSPPRRENDAALEREHLLERPQRLGILPTPWFWNDKENWRLARVPFLILLGIMLFFLPLTELPLWLVAVTPAVVLILGLGVFERYIRHKALQRRAVAEASNASAASLPVGNHVVAVHEAQSDQK